MFWSGFGFGIVTGLILAISLQAYGLLGILFTLIWVGIFSYARYLYNADPPTETQLVIGKIVWVLLWAVPLAIGIVAILYIIGE